ncbi:TIR domain-containing protein [Streptomyces sp. ME02-8801-2C]|uniref:toll/interleukin-1 receptor domain-containing protein n=1 Tax=Streptomyces sp. ME02-8801-2C TaxID=3028680 RepID=UPI0029BB0416|nr:TIR domain-containing protein [Streptomyces sp. ME02-8801-2C]MDX3454538.1 TIR domain-containing protein [Streptomyces sp. ME02-8801-2C]
MLHHVFISYSRRDSAWVDPLVRGLTENGVKCWIDREGIPFSVPWREEVEDAVQACDLFLVCDSEDWRTSPACATEAAYALRFGKVRLEISVGQDFRAAVEQTARAWRHATRRHGTATELSVRARDWHGDGRTRKGLASWRLRRRFEVLHKDRTLSQIELAYLTASRRRNRRQAAVSVALTLLLLVAYLSGRVAPGVEKEVNKRLAEQATRYFSTLAALTVIKDDPYEGLQLAAGLGDNESFADAEVLEGALEVDLPDDAFTLPGEGRRFTDPTVGAQVRVTAGDGTIWGRGASDRTRRSAARSPGNAADPAAGAGTAPEVSLRWQAGRATMRVLRQGKPWRAVVLESAVRAAQLSPDERWAAVATDAGVALVDLVRGTVRDVLRGAPGPVTSLAWTARGDRVWALTGRSVVSWDVADGDVVLDQPEEWFQDVFPASDNAHLWVANRDGELRLLARASGAVVRSLKVGGSISSAVSDPSGKAAAVVGTDNSRLWTVDLTTGTARTVGIPSTCSTARPVYSRDGHTLYVPCLQGDVLVVDARSRRVAGKIDVPERGATAVALAPSGNHLFLATGGGHVYTVDIGSKSAPEFVYRVSCGPYINAIATAPGPRILPVGEGTGLTGCTQVARTKDDGTYRWDAFIDSPPDSVLALAAAYDPTAKAFAIGYSDGSVILHPSDNIMPRQVLSHIAGGVRSMLTLPTAGPGEKAGDLYVATRAGLLIRIPWCTDCLSNKAMAHAAEERLRQAESLGLYTPSAASPTPSRAQESMPTAGVSTTGRRIM